MADDFKAVYADAVFKEALFALAHAGRWMGSGPAVASDLMAQHLGYWQAVKQRDFPDQNKGVMTLGISLGLLMAQDKDALRVIARIEDVSEPRDEWRVASDGWIWRRSDGFNKREQED